MYDGKTAWTVLSDFFSISLKKQSGVCAPSESKEELRSQGSCKRELTLRLCVNSELFPFRQTPCASARLSSCVLRAELEQLQVLGSTT